MRFFKIIEISEDTYLENVGNYDERYLYETVTVNGEVYVSVKDNRTDNFEVDLEQFDEE